MATLAYPKLPESRWWALRNHFRRTVPTRVTPSLIATILSIETSSAGSVLVALRALALIDEEGVPTSLANDWRHDETYGEACRRMFEAAYPQELRDALPPPSSDRSAVQMWFARTLNTGQENARQMAALYVLIADGRVADEQPRERPKSAAVKVTQQGTRSGAKPKQVTGPSGNDGSSYEVRNSSGLVTEPQLQIAVQVNIHAEMSPEQIDQVFKSMAEHLYTKPR